MNKVYITSLHLNHGGIEKIITSLANALDEKGYQVEILCTYNHGECAYHLNKNVLVTYLTKLLPNRNKIHKAIYDKRFFALIKELFYAIRVLYQKRKTMIKALSCIHEGTVISTRHENNVCLSKYGQSGVVKIAQLHEDHGFNKKLLAGIKNKYKNIDYFALLTEKSALEIKDILKGHNNHTKVITIPNFIDSYYSPSPHRLKQIISVGRLHYDKNFESLLSIWKLVSKKHPDWQLKIIGQGELEDKLKNITLSFGIEKSVVFTGSLPHNKVMEQLSVSRCYALTSHSESFGIALVEAMSCGTPPVAYNVRVGPEYIIDDGKDGFLVPKNNESHFAERLEQLISDDELFYNMSTSAIIKAHSFTKENVIKKWIEIL